LAKKLVSSFPPINPPYSENNMRATEALALYNGEIIDEKSQIHYLSKKEILEIKKLRRKKPKSIPKNQTFLGFYQPEADGRLEFNKSFNIFWMIYPKKVGKGYAQKCYKKALKKVSLERIIFAIEKQRKSVEWKDKQFIPNPSTWLNQERWDDELTYKETSKEQFARLKAKGEI